MEFARPLGALALLALPVILWLHRQRRRAPETVVASLQPWAALTASAPRRRWVPPSLLLALRLAAAIAFCVALLDPRPVGGGPDAGDGRAPLALLLDTSTSMIAGGRWQAAQVVVREVIGSAEGPVSLFALGPRPRAILVDELDRGPLLRALAELRPGGVGTGVADAEALADALLAAPSARLVVVTDLPPGAAPALAERATWRRVGGPADNLAVIDIRASRAEGRTFVAARVGNFGRTAADVAVELRLDDEAVAATNVALQARDTRDLQWRIARSAARASVSLRRSDGEPDALPDDDSARIAVARPPTAVQIVGVSEAFERALHALDDVSIERTGLGTLRSPAEGGVTVIVGEAPPVLPAGGIVLVPEARPEPADDADRLARLDGTGLHPLVRGLALAGAFVAPVDRPATWPVFDTADAAPSSDLDPFGASALGGSAVDASGRADGSTAFGPAHVTVLENEGTALIRDGFGPGGGRLIELSFAPDIGDLRARPAFPLLVSRIVARAAPARPPTSAQAGAWVGLPPWSLPLTGPDGDLGPAGFGTDLTARPGWYAVRPADRRAAAIEFGINAGDPFESDLVGAASDLAADGPDAPRSIEWWRVALALGLCAVLVEGPLRPGSRPGPRGGAGRRAGRRDAPARAGSSG